MTLEDDDIDEADLRRVRADALRWMRIRPTLTTRVLAILGSRTWAPP